MNVFIRAMVRIFSFGERWNVPFNLAVASLNGTFHLSPHENILTIALINIHYLYNNKGPRIDPCGIPHIIVFRYFVIDLWNRKLSAFLTSSEIMACKYL